MSRCFIVVKDETDYNGERSYPAVFADRDAAQAYADYERQKAEDWVASMREVGERVGDYVPQFIVEESEAQGFQP